MIVIRVYGIWLQSGSVLLCEEFIGDQRVVKFPGGGLEQGEGIYDCLLREFKEELGFTPRAATHFYTTDFYVRSIIDPSDQVISIYYLIHDDHHPDLNKYNSEGLFFFWKDISSLQAEDFALPIDQFVVNLLGEHLAKHP